MRIFAGLSVILIVIPCDLTAAVLAFEMASMGLY